MNILVISSNLIGDNILSTGIINYFSEKHPNSKFTIVVGPSAAPLYENFPNFEKIIIVKKQQFNLHWLTIWKKCFSKKWDIVIDFRSSLLSYVLFHHKNYVFKKSNNKHHLEQLVDSFHIDFIPYPVIFDNIKETDNANKILNSDKKYVVIAPGGNWIPKIWPAEKFNQLLKLLSKQYSYLNFILVGSIAEKEKYFNKVITDINKNNIIDLMGETLTQTFAYIKKSNLFIGNDSGLMHLSVASKISTIGLFGPTNDKIYAPYGNNCYTLRTKETYHHFKKIIINKNLSYMQSIEVKEVMDLIANKRLL